MGLCSLPAPSEGMLCIVLVNTALTISILKNFIRTILHVFGFRVSPESISDLPDLFSFSTQQFRTQTPTVLFESVCGLILNKGDQDHDCSVCLSQFEPESEVNHLSCGHIFHNTCLEQWLDYCNITCPLCRNPLMPDEDTPSPCVW